MYGFLKSRSNKLRSDDIHMLNISQCGLCHTLRHEYSLVSSPLAGWEGRFLVLLTLAQGFETVGYDTTRCPASMWLRHCSIPENHLAAQYAASVVVWLFREKLLDRIRDDNSSSAEFACRLFDRQFRKSEQVLQELCVPIDDIKTLFAQQVAMESVDCLDTLNQATGPFSEAIGLLTAHTCRLSGNMVNYDKLNHIGKLLGQLITVLDACMDFRRDCKKGQFNLIQAILATSPESKVLAKEQFERVENSVLLTLQGIRSAVEQLSLNKYAWAVQNILLLGLYDAAQSSIRNLLKNVDTSTTVHPVQTICIFCGRKISSRFCPHCGQMRLVHNQL